MTDPPVRPRPTPDGSARAAARAGQDRVVEVPPADAVPVAAPRPGVPTHRTSPAAHGTTRVEVQPSQVVAAAGSAIITAARMGRLLSRSGWRVARQFPGGRTVEREAQRLQTVAVHEARRFLQIPGSLPHVAPAAGLHSTSPDEQRALRFIRDADPGVAPLRSAMGELLERSVEATRTDSRDYLFGTIISQLVPDEARILAALSEGAAYAAADVVHKQRGGGPRVLLANASSLGRQAGLVTPDNTPTYLTRLHTFGLVVFGPPAEDLGVHYDVLATDASVQRARDSVEPRRRGSVRVVRKTVRISPFGRDFWAASDPSRVTQG